MHNTLYVSLQNVEHRQFGTISIGKREDIAEVLVAEGLAATQRHRDNDEKSPRYDDLCAAEVSFPVGTLFLTHHLNLQRF